MGQGHREDLYLKLRGGENGEREKKRKRRKKDDEGEKEGGRG